MKKILTSLMIILLISLTSDLNAWNFGITHNPPLWKKVTKTFGDSTNQGSYEFWYPKQLEYLRIPTQATLDQIFTKYSKLVSGFRWQLQGTKSDTTIKPIKIGQDELRVYRLGKNEKKGLFSRRRRTKPKITTVVTQINTLRQKDILSIKTPSFNKNSTKIVFEGIGLNGFSDIYLWDIPAYQNVQNITDKTIQFHSNFYWPFNLEDGIGFGLSVGWLQRDYVQYLIYTISILPWHPVIPRMETNCHKNIWCWRPNIEQ